MKAGEFFFYAYFDDDAGKVEIDRFGCRVIRAGHAHLTAVHQWTWGKRSKKNGDFGWLDPVAPIWRRRVLIGSREAAAFSRTKRGALRDALARAKRARSRNTDDAEILAYYDASIACISARLKRTKD